MSQWRALLTAAACGLAAMLGALVVATMPVRLEPGTPAWARCVGGADAGGALGSAAVVVIPGVERDRPRRLRIEAEGGPANLGVSIDRAEPAWMRLSGGGTHLVALPATRVPGVHAALRVEGGGRVRLRAVEVSAEGPLPWGAALLLGLAVAVLAFVLPARVQPRLALSLGLVAAGCVAVACLPLLLLWSLPSAPALVRLLVPLAVLGAGLAAGLSSGERRTFTFGVALVAAAVFGAWVRVYFLPSAGSWDVDYWKACALHTNAHGVTHAYGGPDAVPPGHFRAQLRGEEPAWELPAFGRTFVIDQPPGIQLLWKLSWALLADASGRLSQDEALNASAKLPAVAGDVLAVGVLLWAFGGTRRAYALAALYWALPISWLSSAVLGFFDGVYVPLAVAALHSAGRGRAVRAGALLALAALLKSLALLVAPAVAVALWTARAPIRKAAAVGIAIGVAALVPFAIAGTLDTAIVHMYRILFQLRLSGGYGNGWWILGHVLTLDTRAMTDAIPYVRIETAPFPVRPVGTLAFLLVAGWVVRCQLRAPGPRAAALAGAVLVLAYGQLAIGIHENHPHAFVLALVATGLGTRRLRLLAAVFLTTYVLNMLALSGLGRFYTMRYIALDPIVKAAGAVRMGLGFDLTLALAVVNVIAFALLLVWLRGEMEAAAQAGSTRSPESQSPPAAASSTVAASSTGG